MIPTTGHLSRILVALAALLVVGACSDDLPTGPVAHAPATDPRLGASPPDGDGDGIPDAVEPPEGRNPTLKDNDVFGSARLFAMQQYRDFLGREGEPDGIAGWTIALDTGASRAQAVDAFFGSAEFQAVTAPVVRLYLATFDRIPDTAGLLFWLERFREGLPLVTISEEFVDSPEFQSTYGTLSNGDFVDLVYANVLGRSPDPGGRDYWIAQLDGGLPRGALLTGFSESDEYRLRSRAEVYVTLAYVGMLRRSPDPAGFDFWTAQIGGGGSGLALIQGFLDSLEYRDRFLPRGFSGTVRDLFGGGIAGLQVRVGSAAAVVTNSTGAFVTSVPPSGVQPITVSGPGYVTRSTYGSTNAALPNALTVLPSSFDMAAYEQIVRARNGGNAQVPADNASIRWTATPSIYVDTRPEVGTGRVIPASWIHAVVASASSSPDEWSDGLIHPTVASGTNPPADGTPNTIVIRFDNTIPGGNAGGCGGTVGIAQFSWSSNRELRWGVIRLAFGRLCGGSDALMQAVTAHEIGHTMGLGHLTLTGTGRASLMEPVIRLAALSPLDHRNAALHYRRGPGHAAPDVETSLLANRGIAPQAFGPDKRETFICNH